MKFSIASNKPETIKTELLVAAVFEGGNMSPLCMELDQASGGFIDNLIKKAALEGKTGQSLLLFDAPNIAAERILLLGCGKENEMSAQQYSKAIGSALKKANELKTSHVCLLLSALKVNQMQGLQLLSLAAQTVMEALYSYDSTKSSKSDPVSVTDVEMYTTESDSRSCEEALTIGKAVGAGVNFARELGNLPGNICTPSYLADQARQMAKDYKSMESEILEEADMEKLGMGSLLSVSRGSREPAKLIIMKHLRGDKTQKPLVLVGKGLTFDSGGVSIKPGAGMDEMKFDMCGGASVFGTMKTISELDLPMNVIGVVPSSENMPDGAANKPGDVVTSMSGQTIEILNTDAEGRLILCDALTYVERFEPAAVIDIATLTGACVIALGKHASGMFVNHEPLADELRQAAGASADRVWQLPLWEDYQDQLKSNFADMANVGGREAGSITAACFLARYTKKYHWAHLDIAGSAWNSGGEKGATGRPVPLLSRFVLNRLATTEA